MLFGFQRFTWVAFGSCLAASGCRSIMFHVSVLLLWLGYFVLFLWSNHQIQTFHIKAAIQIPVHVSLLVELLFVTIEACHESAACWTEAFWHFAGCAGTAAGPRHCAFRELCGASAAYRGVSATVKKMETSSKFRRTIKAGDRSTDDSEKIPQKMHMKSYNISIYHIQFFICEICSSLIFRMYHNASWKETSEINGKSWQGYYCIISLSIIEGITTPPSKAARKDRLAAWFQCKLSKRRGKPDFRNRCFHN